MIDASSNSREQQGKQIDALERQTTGPLNGITQAIKLGGSRGTASTDAPAPKARPSAQASAQSAAQGQGTQTPQATQATATPSTDATPPKISSDPVAQAGIEKMFASLGLFGGTPQTPAQGGAQPVTPSATPAAQSPAPPAAAPTPATPAAATAASTGGVQPEAASTPQVPAVESPKPVVEDSPVFKQPAEEQVAKPAAVTEGPEPENEGAKTPPKDSTGGKPMPKGQGRTRIPRTIGSGRSTIYSRLFKIIGRMFPDLTKSQIDLIIDELRKIADNDRGRMEVLYDFTRWRIQGKNRYISDESPDEKVREACEQAEEWIASCHDAVIGQQTQATEEETVTEEPVETTEEAEEAPDEAEDAQEETVEEDTDEGAEDAEGNSYVSAVMSLLRKMAPGLDEEAYESAQREIMKLCASNNAVREGLEEFIDLFDGNWPSWQNARRANASKLLKDIRDLFRRYLDIPSGVDDFDDRDASPEVKETKNKTKEGKRPKGKKADKDYGYGTEIDTTGTKKGGELSSIRGFYNRAYSKMLKSIETLVYGKDKPRSAQEALREGDVDYDFDKHDEEGFLENTLKKVRFLTRFMFINPTQVRIQCQKVVTRKSKNGKRKFSRIEFTNVDVMGAIGNVRKLYGISTANVIRLIVLRSGIGFDTSFKLSGQKPGDFTFTDEQVIQLCRDICESQRLYGHPMALVRGTPGGVRSNDGMFVVVAGTKCYPMGYMPRMLRDALRTGRKSPLNGMSDRALCELMQRQWLEGSKPLNDTGVDPSPSTYQTLLDDAALNGEDVLKQAWSIENAMRAYLEMDGVDMSKFDIKKANDVMDLARLRAEMSKQTDPDIIRAQELRYEDVKSKKERALLTYKTERGADGPTRDEQGRLITDNLANKRNDVGNFAGILSLASMTAKCLNAKLISTNLVEEGLSILGQRVGVFATQYLLGDTAEDKYTTELENIARSDEFVNAFTTISSLYRIGGLDLVHLMVNELEADGQTPKYSLNQSGLRQFCDDYGITGTGKLSNRVRSFLHMDEKTEAAFRLNAQNLVDFDNNVMLGSGMFRRTQADMFMRGICAEMAMARNNGREWYTSDQMAGFAYGPEGHAGLVRQAMMTDAGIEAFMTHGITSLARKSPTERLVRMALSKNRVVEATVRFMFDRFPEYGIQKILRQIPMCNTVGYLLSYGVKGVGDLLAKAQEGGMVNNAGKALQRSYFYRAGARNNFLEGLAKNFIYDMINCGSQLALGFMYFQVIMHLGGVRPPKRERDLTNWSEWIIGDGTVETPIKWAWYMDDLSGIGLPFGLALAIMSYYDESQEGREIATTTFINAIAELDRGTCLVDAIDLVNNFDDQWDSFVNPDVKGYDPSPGEYWGTMTEMLLWDFVGDLTPTLVEQFNPLSKDFLFRSSEDPQHTAARVYAEGMSVDEAMANYETEYVDGFREYMRRREAQSNTIAALLFNAMDDGTTGYFYKQQPIDTVADPAALELWNRFYLDLDELPAYDQEAYEQALIDHAEMMNQWIHSNYTNPQQAIMEGFSLSADARACGMWYCWLEIERIDNAYDRKFEESGWLPDEEFNALLDQREAEIDVYEDLIYNYYRNYDIPSSLPRYMVMESDTAGRYVNSDGSAGSFLGMVPGVRDILGLDETTRESYRYGGQTSEPLPFTTPDTTAGYNYESIPYFIRFDDQGNMINDTNLLHDVLDAAGPITMGRWEGQDLLERYFGGQGDHAYDDVDEELAIPAGGVPTLGDRGYKPLESSIPDALLNIHSGDDVAAYLGLPQSPEEKADEEAEGGEGSDVIGGYGYGYGKGYRRYSRGGGSYGNRSYTYNPKIYSTDQDVNADTAAGMNIRQPYKATTTYLRPGFATKGSREAYRRNDI